MSSLFNLYIDESGSRDPEHLPSDVPARPDFFGFGGILVKEEDEPEMRERHRDFCREWKIQYPLHSTEIRNRSKNFRWLNACPGSESSDFYESLTKMLTSLPVYGIACVVDRPGYNARYRETYRGQRWSLCKSAFSILIERAAKFALKHEARVMILPERCGKKEDRWLASYVRDLQEKGHPFHSERAGKYDPLDAVDFQKLICGVDFKAKSSPGAQIADLYLWPICKGGYDSSYRSYRDLVGAGRLIESRLSEAEWPAGGTKYFCFDDTRDAGAEKAKARPFDRAFVRPSMPG